jgi:exosortase
MIFPNSPEGIRRDMIDTEIKEPDLNRNVLVFTALIVVVSFAVLYQNVIAKLATDWFVDDNYSHGIFILPIALYFAWKKRDLLAEARLKPRAFGLIIILASIAVMLAGILGSELFLTRISMLGTIAGAILYLCGWRHLKILIMPILFLILMIPIPAIIFNQIAFPLQLIASRFGEIALSIVGVPVLREGNIIRLANTSLEVVEACSGIRSLISLLTLSIVFGYFMESRTSMRTVLAIATIPIAVFSNGLRVSLTGIAAHYYGPEAAEGFMHLFSGWVIFVLAFIMLFMLQRLIAWLAPAPKAKK